MPKKPASSALDSALNYLSRREYYRQELCSKLLKKGHPRTEVEALLNRLEKDGSLSDRRYLDAFIYAKQRKLYGPQWIRAQLRSKGFTSEAIEQALEDCEADWQDNLKRCYDKKCAGQQPADITGQRKVQSYLYRRGYPSELIKKLF